LKQAQEEQEAARAAYAKAEKDSLAAHAMACSCAYVQCPKTFSAFFSAFEKLFEQGVTVAQDMEPYNIEFERAAKALEAADAAGGTAHGAANVRKEAVADLIE
jgi:hypothetical protein